MRPKEFSRKGVLERCIILFWEQGYTATGIEKIVEVTNVNRYSLYEEFGNKKGILLAALQLYSDRHVSFGLLINSSSVKEVVYQFLFSFFKPTIGKNHPVGCFITSIGMELREDKELKTFINGYLETLKDNFSKLLSPLPSIEESNLSIVSKQLTYFYCSAMSMCVILTVEDTEKYLNDNLNLITKCLKE